MLNRSERPGSFLRSLSGVRHSYRGLVRATRLCPFRAECPSFLAQVTEAKRKISATRSPAHPRIRAVLPPLEFQTQPEPVVLATTTPSNIPCLASCSRRPLLLLSFPGCVARSRPNGHEEGSFLSFGAVRKGLGTLPRNLGSRRRNRGRLRTCNIPNHNPQFLITLCWDPGRTAPLCDPDREERTAG